MAAYDLRGEHTVHSAAVQLYKVGAVPKVLHKMPGTRVAKRHAAMTGTDMKNFEGPLGRS